MKELIGFAAAHALDERIISDESTGIELIGALEAFARWADTTQGLPLQKDFDELARGLRSSLPRILRVRCGVELPARGGRLYRIEREGQDVRLVDADDERIPCQLEPEQASWLRSGDLVRAELGAEGRLERAAYYPPQAAQALGLEQD